MSGIGERIELLEIARELEEAAVYAVVKPLATLRKMKAAADRIRHVVYPVKPPRKTTVQGTQRRTGTGDR